MADMLVAYCEGTACRRRGYEVVSANRRDAGIWRRIPYAAALMRAYQLLAIRKGARGRIRLPPNWKERIGEAGIDWETMEVKAGCELKWARAWKQFCEYDSFRIDRQRQWNALGEKAEWPCPELSWEARSNSKVMRGKVREKVKEEAEEPAKKFDVTSRYRKRIMMR